MDRRLFTLVSLGVLLAGCVRPAPRSAYDPFSPPKQNGSAVAQLPEFTDAITTNIPTVIGANPPSELRVTVGQPVSDQVKKVRLSSRSAHATAAQANWTITGPVKADGNGNAIALATGPIAQSAKWPEGYSTLTIEALDASGKVIGSSRKMIVNVGNVLNRAIVQVQGAGLPLLAQNEPYRAAAWLGAAATIDRLKVAIAREQAGDAGRLVHEMQTRIEILKRNNSPSADHSFLHDLLILSYYPDAQVTVEYPSPDTANIVFNCGPIPMTEVVVQQFATADAAQVGFASRLPDVPTKPAELFQQPTKFSTVWTRSEEVDPALLDLHENLFIWTADDKSTIEVVAPDTLKDHHVDAVLIAPRAHAQPAKAAAIYAEEQSLPLVTFENPSGAKRILIAGDIRKDDRFAKMRYQRSLARQGAAQLCVLDGRRLLTCIAPTLDAAAQAVKLVQRGQPVREEQTDWLRRAVVLGIDRSVKAEMTPMLCGDIHMRSATSDAGTSPAGAMLDAMYSLQDFSVMSDPNTLAGAERAKKLLSAAGINYPLITSSVHTHDSAQSQNAGQMVIFTTDATGDALAAALKDGKAVAVQPESGTLFVGQEQWQRRALSTLADASALKKAKAQRIREVLRSARVADLLNASEAAPIVPETAR